MSPHNLFIRVSDGRVVLGLDKPGPELKDSKRGGDWERVALGDRRGILRCPAGRETFRERSDLRRARDA